MTDYIVAGADLTAVANKIRSKGGTSAQLEFPSEFISAIEAIEGGGGGGSTNILSGSSAPTSGVGSDGDVYLLIDELPSGYTRAEYIAGDGASYIDTGVSFTATSDVSLIVDISGTFSGWKTIIGGQTSNTVNSWLIGINSLTQTTFQRGTNKYANTNYSFQQGEEYEFKTDGVLMRINDAIHSYVGNQGTFTTGATMYLFAAHTSNGVDSICDSSIRFKEATFYDSFAITNHFVPSVRDSDSAVGIYDTVNGLFHANAGSGDFSSGGQAGESSILATYLKVNGSWQPLVGSDIDYVDTGGN